MIIFHETQEVDAFQRNTMDYVRSEVLSVIEGDSSFVVLTKDRAVLFDKEFEPEREFFDIEQVYYIGCGHYSLISELGQTLQVHLYDEVNNELEKEYEFEFSNIIGVQLSGNLLLLQSTDAFRLFKKQKLIARFRCSDVRRCDLHINCLTILDSFNMIRLFAIEGCDVRQSSKFKIELNFVSNVFEFSKFIIVLGEKLIAVDYKKKRFLSQAYQNAGIRVSCTFSESGDYAFLSEGYSIMILSMIDLIVAKIIVTPYSGAIISGGHAFLRGNSDDNEMGGANIYWRSLYNIHREQFINGQQYHNYKQIISNYEKFSLKIGSNYYEYCEECCQKIHKADRQKNNEEGDLVRACSIDSYFTTYIGVAQDKLFVGGWDGVLRVYQFVEL